MKKTRGFILLLALALMGFSASLRAEDTDIYVDNASNSGVPNILFVMDNGANFSANVGTGCSAYSGTTEAPSMGTSTASGVLQCALVDAINSLPGSGVVNIGLLVSNASNFATDVRSTSDAAYHEICSTAIGGCLLRKLTLMNASNKASLISFIKSWNSQGGGNTATSFGIKVNTATPATTMQEAWAYLSGKIGMSGTSYANSIIATGCQKNFVIYIGNTNKDPAQENNPSPYNGTNALTSSQVNATAAQLATITSTVKFNPAVCGATSSSIANNWADEWSRYMYQTDGGTSTQQGAQNITTYSIGINTPTCQPTTAALLSSMANVGGGKYFSTGNAAEVTAALESVLNEVQAVNSVFSSASLPVSVNAEGSYLNQIYLGMFRPDGTGAPRWLGNLKQYQLILNSSGNLVLGDSLGNPAISSAGTGFISPNALSFWTSKDTSKAPDNAATGGFYVNDPKGVPLSPYDSPDGEVVEKGGVAQQLRLEALTADFSTTAGSSTNPRRMYTYCPSGSSCNPSLTDVSNAFSTTNSGIASTAFGTSSSGRISSIVRTGTSALVTTIGNHGFTTGSTVTISNVTPTDYNVTQAVTVNSATTFTITGLPDYPTTPSAGTYNVSTISGSPVSIVSITRNTSATGSSNTETATVTTSTAHGFTGASSVVVSGAFPTVYDYSGLPTITSATTFTFPVTVDPPASAMNTYTASVSPSAYPAKTVSLSKSGSTVVGVTSTAHGFWIGESITISGSSVTAYNGTFKVASTASTTQFTVSNTVSGNPGASTGSVVPDGTAQAVTLGRVGTTSTVTATASGAPASFFGNATGMTRVVNIAKSGGSATNESAYVQSNITVTCANATCTAFTYAVATNPATSATGTMSASLVVASVPISAGGITRTASPGTNATAVATVSGVTASAFVNGQTVSISTSGAAMSGEGAYVGSWAIACTAPCTSFTFGPVALTPTPTGSGSSMQAYSGSTPPDKNTIIRWVRGEDNYGDEKGPGGTITVRPSIHGDVLHSRPLVINYGDSRGIAVFYGSNDGVYHAVNGNQTGAIGTVPAGDELWSLVLPEHYGAINRLRVNSPEIKFPSTLLPTAQPKDYFVDGPTGAYQKLKADGTIDTAYIFMTMRRGGRFIYALDVSTPTAPVVLWKIDSSSAGFGELGQSWSRPRLTLLQGGGSTISTTPVLVFGAGYDPAEDSESPGTDTMGRGIFVVNAATGALIWSANSSCVTSATCLNVPGMTYAIPSDIGFVDRDLNGLTDKMYVGDVGGNLWRIDVSDSSTSNWKVTKLAALGCATGTCAAGTTPRKFFFPPSVLTVKAAGSTGSYDLVSLGSGDREHPLLSTATGSSYNVANEFFTILDTGTSIGAPVTNNVTMGTLFNATTTPYAGTLDGFYVSFTTGEKAVNAPLAVNGSIFFATNRPVAPSQTCAANLGEAKAYAISPFLGTTSSNILPGGGLAPSAVSGLITITTKNADGATSSSEQKFCIGCGINGGGSGGSGSTTCNSALENCNAVTSIPKNMKRTYWYRK